jgi:16S rRNA G966 N2-methylase RsmD
MLTYLYYARYFFYIAINWNLRLASFSIYHEIRGERKYGIHSSRLNDLQKLEIKGNNRKEAEVYQGAGYYLLEKIFLKLQEFKAPDDIIDIGSGKGRVMVVAAHYGFKKIMGIDFAIELCKVAERNCATITKQFPLAEWAVIHANAADFTFTQHNNVFFFFNPFKEPVMDRVIKNILQSLAEHPRKIFVAYMNPQHKNLFKSAGFQEVFYIKRMPFVDAGIYSI